MPAARFDLVSLGELVIDLVPAPSPSGDLHFAAKPGGAPGNVAVGAARLGLRSAMLGRVGPDAFGARLVAVLGRNGVDCAGIARAGRDATRLAVVTLDDAGERDFAFYRHGCADAGYGPQDVALAVVSSGRALHVGSLFLGQPASADAQRFAVAEADRIGIPVVADPNLRPLLWDDRDAMVAAGREAARSAAIVKVSEDELLTLTACPDAERGRDALWHSGLKLLAVTRGAGGASLHTASARADAPGFAVEVADTIGCGDAFLAALLADLARVGFDPDRLDLARTARRACAAGALTATRAGGMESLPTSAELDAFLETR